MEEIDKLSDDDEKKSINFHQMDIDDRILKAIAQLGWTTPTIIQEKAIPLLLEGKDVLVRARTGSGKTAAFSIPLIQKILNSKLNASEQIISALIIAPSKELCSQIRIVMDQLTCKCHRIVRAIDISSISNENGQKNMLLQRPDIIISTPAKILPHLKSETISLRQGFETLIIDEADLIFAFGFEQDLREILRYLPPIYQAILSSATLSTDITTLKRLVLHNPVILKLEEPELAPPTQLIHYRITAEENDKAAILYALFKLHLLRGKNIIFVNTVDKCYKLKLFLEQFSIKSCVLNSELPAKIRCHAVYQFNQGIYDIIIASDERSLEQPNAKLNKLAVKRRSDKESSMARGIDFQCVSNVINFDFPLDINSYIHRAGRTARGNNTGSVLSFVSTNEKSLIDELQNYLTETYGTDDILVNYRFKLEEVEPFRYRAKDAWRVITRIAIHDARLKEIKTQLFNNEKLKSYFENNPRDLQVLRHDKLIGVVKKQEHLSDVPDYIIPDSLKHMAGITTTRKRKQHQQTNNNKRFGKSKTIYEAQRNDPLLCANIDYKSKRKAY